MRILILVLTLALPASVLAVPPRYYEAREALSVRSAPEAEAEAVGRLDAGAGPIEVTAEADGWGRVQWWDTDGWIALDRLAPATPENLAAAAAPVGLVCAGTEPFWSLTFTGPAEAVFDAPDTEPLTYAITSGAAAEGRLDFPAALALAAPSAETLAVMRPRECADGMSDRTYGWSLDLITRREGDMVVLTGCCRLPIGQ